MVVERLPGMRMDLFARFEAQQIEREAALVVQAAAWAVASCSWVGTLPLAHMPNSVGQLLGIWGTCPCPIDPIAATTCLRT